MFPYETEFVLTQQESAKAVRSCFFRMGGLLPVITALLAIIGIICMLYGQSEIAAELLIGAVLLPPVTYLISLLKTRLAYRSDRIAQNTVVRYKFFETFFNAAIPNGSWDINYADLYRVIETKDRFYLFTNVVNLYVVDKTRCHEGLVELLRNVKCSLKPARIQKQEQRKKGGHE